MNKYGKLAMSHWKQTDPDRYAAIADPQTFFGDLGDEAETQIAQLAETLAGPDQPGEEYLQKVGRLNMARLQAEEAILSDLVWISGPEQEEDPDPTTAWVTQTMREIRASDEEDDASED